MKKLFLAFLLAVYPVVAAGQQSVQQSGQITPGHPVQWITNGIVGDGGTPSAGGLTGLGVTAVGDSICARSGATGAYNLICLGANSGTNGAGISVTNIGGASGGFTLSLNGTTQGFSTTSLPTTPNSTACFSNTTGTLTNCAGGTVTGPGSSTNNALAVWSGTSGASLINSAVTLVGSNLVGATLNGNTITTGTGTLTLGAGKTFTASNTLTLTGTDSTSFGFPPTSDTVVGIAAAQTLTNKTLTTPIITGGTISGNTITTGTGTLTLGAGKTFTASNTITLTGTDGTSFGFPTTSDTVVGIGATQTLTNKTLTAPVVNNASTLSAGTNGSVGGTLVLNGVTSGAATVAVLPGAGTTNFTLPNTNGSVGQLLQTDGSGNTSWTTATGTGTVTSITGSSGISTGTGAAITATGTLYDIRPPGGRLTLVTGTPVMVNNQTAKGTLFYDCFDGNGTVPYYNGTADLTDSIASCEVSDAMVSAASAGQVVSGQVYDVWWVHGGASRICLAMSAAAGGGGGWASDTGGSNTARGTGYSQLDTTTRAFITNKNSIPNCFNAATNYGPVSANQGTYLGTIYATANGQTGMAYTSSAALGGAGILGLYNAYNQVRVSAYEVDTSSSWTISSATWRRADNNTNNSVSYVDGLGTSQVESSYSVVCQLTVTTVGCNTGSALDWASGAPPTQCSLFQGSTITLDSTITCPAEFLPAAGFHTVTAVEAGYNATLVTFFGSGFGGSSTQVQRLSVRLNM